MPLYFHFLPVVFALACAFLPSIHSFETNTTTPVALSGTLRTGLTFDTCTPSSRCKAPRRCRNLRDGSCSPGDSTCLCIPRFGTSCNTSAVCPRNEICAQTDEVAVFCASATAVRSLSILAPVPPPKKLPSSGRAFDDCDNSPKSRCMAGLTCRVISSGNICSGQRNCGCEPGRGKVCFRSKDCPSGETCAQLPSSIAQVPICVAEAAPRRWIGIEAISFPVTRGFSLEPCTSDSQCVNTRKCLAFTESSLVPCSRSPTTSCGCLIPRLNDNACRRTRDCASKQEVCAETAFLTGPICVSILARNAYNHVMQVESTDVCPVLISQDPPSSSVRVSTRSLSINARSTTIMRKNYKAKNLLHSQRSVRLGEEEQPAIVGGLPASSNLQRSLVLLINRDNSQCSGVLISRTWLLTAAHCQIKTDSEAIIGLSLINRAIAQRTKRFKVRQVKTHPLFKLSTRTRSYDIAAVQLASVAPSSAVPMLVNSKLETPKDRSAVRAIGYGLTSPDERPSEIILRQVDLLVTPTAECNKKSLMLLFPRPTARRLQICADTPRERCGICFGDSGGPLVSYEGGRPVIVGISSTSVNCVTTTFPGFFTRVSTVVPWIRTTGATFMTN